MAEGRVIVEATSDADPTGVTLIAEAEDWHPPKCIALRLVRLETRTAGAEPASLAVDPKPPAIVTFAFARLDRFEHRACGEA